MREALPENTSLSASRTLVVLGDTSDAREIIPLITHRVRFPESASASSSVTSSVAITVDGSQEATSSVASVTTIIHSTSSAVPARVSLVIHECTDAWIPPEIDTKGRTGRNRRLDTVYDKALEKGHSIPAMAGAFAKAVSAERLVLNHIGSRYDHRSICMFCYQCYLTFVKIPSAASS